MYSTCIFCHASLGTNEGVEHFPIGRRLAFDAARGRLWVVCRRCERWNLTPLEERWEAIEDCERLFRGSKLRVSTENIGLARVADAMELVRIGSPQRPEMAAWRYGDQFGRRRRRHLVWTAGGGAALIGLVVAGPVTGLIAGGSLTAFNLGAQAYNLLNRTRVRARVPLPGHSARVALRLGQLHRVRLARSEDGWFLRVPYARPVKEMTSLLWYGASLRLMQRHDPAEILTGDAALYVASKLLPAINARGAKRGEVSSAVDLLSETPDPARLLDRYADYGGAPPVHDPEQELLAGNAIANLPHEVRLALEMATHEDAERRALEGELTALEMEWRQAEEIAAIADDLFVGDDTRQRLDALKDGGRG
ncbi:MAG TPA: hypothetical protein VHB25_15370 [Gemmatimonadaceae bacterium]|nr:hypothetical protein [Gemmatimonadaceae bacterium]